LYRTALSRGLSRAAVGGSVGAGRCGSQSQRSASQSAPSVALPPPRCVVCQNACSKPFEAACGHPGCYGCWLGLLSAARGPGAPECPSCHKPVVKRQLSKVFFT
jgi:hypothetical protein